MYKVFEIDDCFTEYAMSYFLIGATDKQDIIDKLPDIFKEWGRTKTEARRIIKEKEWRIKEIEHLFTDTPYIQLNGYGYVE